jgi:protein-disulfide isomerase
MADSSTNKMTIWFIIGLVVVTAGVIVIGAFSSGSGSGTTSANGFVSSTVPALTSSDWTIGNPNAKVSMIEYGDFECPACGEYEPIVEQLIANYSSSVLFSFRNFPLYSIHPFAGIGAEAAEAAGMMGGASKYWAMHDLLYADQTTWAADTSITPAQVISQYFNGYAQSLGLDVTTFDADMNSSQVSNKIQNDVNTGNEGQLNHTPTFFINLEQIPNPTSEADFETVLNQALAAASSTVPADVTVNANGSSTVTVTSTAK